jgi:hypothetical protein
MVYMLQIQHPVNYPGDCTSISQSDCLAGHHLLLYPRQIQCAIDWAFTLVQFRHHHDSHIVLHKLQTTLVSPPRQPGVKLALVQM